jgi:ribosomal protein S4E
MNYKVNDIVTINGIDDCQFRVVMFSEKSLNLMLVKEQTNQLWSAHIDDVTKVEKSQQ